jgi:hypothetical protein
VAIAQTFKYPLSLSQGKNDRTVAIAIQNILYILSPPKPLKTSWGSAIDSALVFQTVFKMVSIKSCFWPERIVNSKMSVFRWATKEASQEMGTWEPAIALRSSATS